MYMREVQVSFDASELLGAQQIAGTKVMSKGSSLKAGARSAGLGVGGALGGVISATASGVANKRQGDQAATPGGPPLTGNALLAVTDQEVALVKINFGGFNGKLGDVLTRMPRSQVAAVRFHGGYISKLDVELADGSTWNFEVPKGSGKGAKAIAELFGG
jgi:hypothetical protein